MAAEGSSSSISIANLIQSALTAPAGPSQSSLLSSILSQIPQSLDVTFVSSSLLPILSSSRFPPSITSFAASALHLALSNSKLAPPIKLDIALKSLSSISRLLNSRSSELEKLGLQAFASVYPIVFKHLATSGNNSEEEAIWTSILNLKANSVQLFRTGKNGPKVTSVKVIQRIIQSQTRGSPDPRLQRTAEPNLNHLRPSHPYLRPNLLEEEANKLLEELITSLFTTTSSDLIAALVSSLVGLVKLRSGMTQLVVTALVNWSPGNMERELLKGGGAGAVAGAQGIRAAEKSVKAGLNNLLKTSHAATFQTTITEFFETQSRRMDEAAKAVKLKKDQETSKKRQQLVDTIADTPSTSSSAPSSKRRKLEPATEEGVKREPMLGEKEAWEEVANRFGTDQELVNFDVTALGVKVVSELVVENLRWVSEEDLKTKLSEVKSLMTPKTVKGVLRIPLPSASGGPLDPLKADLGDEELSLKAEVPPPEAPDSDTDDELDVIPSASLNSLDLIASSSSPTSSLDSKTRIKMIKSSLKRIFEAGLEGNGGERGIWVGLATRLVTRGGVEEEEEELRDTLGEFAEEGDVKARMEFAKLWLIEEWYVGGFSRDENHPYCRSLRKLLTTLLPLSTNKDKTFIPFFSQFVADLPWLPQDEIRKVGVMCTKPSQVQLGFAALHDLALLRPPARQTAVDVLLELTSHPDKLTRNAAITTVKRWVPEVPSLSPKVSAFSKILFSRLSIAPPVVEEPIKKNVDGEEEMEMEMEMDMDEDDDEEEKPVVVTLAKVEDGEVVEGLPPPTTLPEILQHVELLFALSIKEPELLAHVFESYASLQPFAQESILTLITPVIKTLGLTCDKLTEMIEECGPGTDVLVLKVLDILADKGRLPASHVEVIKQLAKKRTDLHPRLLMLCISECDKVEIIRYVPRILTLLNNTPQEKAAVRSTFLSIIIAPSQQFGSSSNAPRTKQGELLTPVELLILLHTSEKEAGLKQVIEAIGICFSMPDAFRTEMFASFMQQVIELPVIPTLFMRTVIQAVSTYKALQAYASSTLLNKLIARQVWTTGPLWEGFVRLAKATAPNSFNALLGLPTENLKEVIAKQPSLQMPLREFVFKKVGVHRQRVEHQLEVLGGEQEEGEAEGEGGEDSEPPVGEDSSTTTTTPFNAEGVPTGPSSNVVQAQPIEVIAM